MWRDLAAFEAEMDQLPRGGGGGGGGPASWAPSAGRGLNPSAASFDFQPTWIHEAHSPSAGESGCSWVIETPVDKTSPAFLENLTISKAREQVCSRHARVAQKETSVTSECSIAGVCEGSQSRF